jgi:hypothetical protein
MGVQGKPLGNSGGAREIQGSPWGFLLPVFPMGNPRFYPGFPQGLPGDSPGFPRMKRIGFPLGFPWGLPRFSPLPVCWPCRLLEQPQSNAAGSVERYKLTLKKSSGVKHLRQVPACPAYCSLFIKFSSTGFSSRERYRHHRRSRQAPRAKLW